MNRWGVSAVVAVLLFAGRVAGAATSQYALITIAGSFNGFNTTSTPMTLVSDHQWQANVALPATNRIQFLFVTNGSFAKTWKDVDQTWFGPWLDGVAETNAGVDIVLSNTVAATYRFSFHETTRIYRVEQLFTNAIAWTSRHAYVNLAGTFNGFNTLTPNMQLISNGVWQAYVSLSNATNVQFLFATENFGRVWKEINQTIFSLPLIGQTEDGAGSDIQVAGTLNATLRFQFDELTGRYVVENVTAGEAVDLQPWINEFHYDNVGTDVGEFVEVAGPAGLSLTNYALVLYNGADGAVYNTRTLSNAIPNQSGGFGAVAFFYPANGIQNGDPDGIALARLDPPQVLEFLTYEGTFTALGGPANGVLGTDVGVAESNSSTPIGHSLQRVGTGFVGSAFTWVTPRTNSPGLLNSNQAVILPPQPVNVLLSNLYHAPASPGPLDAVHVFVQATPVLGATNLSLAAFYRINSNGLFVAQPMIPTGGAYRTIEPIPAQPIGTIVEYYAHANFRGPGTNSPVKLPFNAPATVARFGVSRIPVGSVWINEIAPAVDLFSDPPIEYIELAGWAGSDISSWRVRLYDDFANLAAEYTLPAGSILPADMPGFGFYILGSTNVPQRDQTLTALLPGGIYLPLEGGVELLDEFGMRQHAVWYSKTNAPPGFDWLYFDSLAFLLDPVSVGYRGTGGVLSAFTITNFSPSVSTSNTGQVLVGGNTNPILPRIVCPSNILLACPSSPIPTANVASVIATGYCGGGSVTVTHLGDVTNSGTGCFGSPRLITRTYRAVSECATTNSCTQLITVQDSGPPALSIAGGTQALVNAGFESASIFGWTPFGPQSNRFAGSVFAPYQGFAHGIYTDPASAVAYDSSENGNEGRIWGAPDKGMSGTNRIDGTAYRLNGTNAYIEIPFAPDLYGPTSFSFSIWTRWEAPTNRFQALLSARSASPNRGYVLQGSNGVWQFVTGQTGSWHILSGPPIVSGQWVHIVGVLSNTTKYLHINNSTAQVGGVAYAAITGSSTRIGSTQTSGLGTDTMYRGSVDELQLFNRALSPAEVGALFNGGSGGPTGSGVRAHFKLDEPPVATNSVSGVMQSLPASNNQAWTLSGFFRMPTDLPLQVSNRAALVLQFLNSSSGVLAAVTSQHLSASSPKDTYARLSASAVAPSNTAYARAHIQHARDSDAAGRFYFDSISLSRFTFDPGTNCVISLPDLRVNVNAVDPCGVVATNQFPMPGAHIGPGDHTVTFVATDSCGGSSTARVTVSVVDSVPPALLVSNLLVECEGLITPSSGVTVVDCGPVNLYVVSESVSGGAGCVGDPRVITRTLQANDSAGFTVFATQIITQRLTSAPLSVCSSTGALLNSSFEFGTDLTNWSRFGNAFSSAAYARTGGVKSARISGLGIPSENYSGIYQDLPAVAGQHWRAAGWYYVPTNNPLSGSNVFVLKLEFLDAGGGFVSVTESAPVTSASPLGEFRPVSVQGVAPAGATQARIAAVFVQRGAAPGELYFDDAALNMTTFTSNTNGQYALPDMTKLWTNANPCADLVVTQNVSVGTLLPVGATNIQLVARNQCGLSATCSVTVLVIDESPPLTIPSPPTNVVVVGLSMTPTGITVRSLGTNTWSVHAEYTTNLLGIQQWFVIPSLTNVFISGTNISTFDPPVTNSPVLFRIWQKYP